jgi:tartrate-resistant acid phosphatase type 5
MDRRRALQTLFCFSTLATRPGWRLATATPPSATAQHLLAIGDFGTTGSDQHAVSAAMQSFMAKHTLQPQGLLLLGDNFYSTDKGGFGVDSPRWKNTFEEVYPAASFPGPCWSILGNHDYHDNVGGEKVQLEYARRKSTRWQMPGKWYRFEVGPAAEAPWLTVLALDSNLPKVSGGSNSKKARPSLSQAEAEAQQTWLEAELAKPRAAMTLVLGHHPLYSNGQHGDTQPLIESWGPLFQKHAVQAYLCGHDHDLQHLELEGCCTSFVLSGGGGARIRALTGHRPAAYGKSSYGFTHLEVFPQALRFSHYNKEGECLHQFTKQSDGTVALG